MPTLSLSQLSFFHPEYCCPWASQPGTLPWLLLTRRAEILPAWLFRAWRGEARCGRKAWPAQVLAAMLLLRWAETGMSHRAMVRRAAVDAAWRAALGLGLDVPVPSGRTLREFERFMRSRHPDSDVPRYLLLHEHVIRLCCKHGVVGNQAAWGVDSTPTWCYGATLDTVRLLGDGVRLLGQKWSRATGESIERTAKSWDLPLLLAKSTKGGIPIDWRDRQARHGAVSSLADAVLAAVRYVVRRIGEVRSSFRKGLLKLGRRLAGVVRDDLEQDKHGNLVIAQRVAKNRLISLTDPEARNGRKSKSSLFQGFKTHVLGDFRSGLIASVAITPGNEHDSGPAHRLVRRAKALFDQIGRVFGDTAYGGTDLRKEVEESTGVKLFAPPPAGSKKAAGFGKRDFVIDFDHGTATCPAGVQTSDRATVRCRGVPCERFAWPRESCMSCSLRQDCKPNGARRTLALHPEEALLRKIRDEWKQAEVKQDFRQRCETERLVNRIVRHGARKAWTWGLARLHAHVHFIAATCNLLLLATKLWNNTT